jgi:transcriptional regulator with XRE-family HTH domain
MNDTQEEVKTKLKAWLKLNNKTYADVAEACYVTEATVRNWMAKKKIPIAKLMLIEQLITSAEIDTVAISKEETTTATAITPIAAIDMLRQLKQVYPELNYTQSVLALIGELSLR